MNSPWLSPRSTADGSGYAGEESLPATTSPDYALSTQDFSTPSTGWQLDDFVLDPGYVASREELRWLMLNTAQTAPSSPAHVDSFASEADQQGGETLSSAQHQSSHLLSQGRRVEYFKNYISQVAPWLDMFDSSRAFGIQVPLLAQTSPALLCAILAISARQMERKEASNGTPTPQKSFDSLELYQESIRLLTPLLEAHDPAVIPICVILCCLEMMSASARDWRRHLEGCAALFDAFQVHGFCGGLLQAVFWCHARMDLCGALISDGTQSTIIPPIAWLSPGTDEANARQCFHKMQSPDMHANYAVYLCAKACELISDRTHHDELGVSNGCTAEVFSSRWTRLWDDLQAWIDDRPHELLPLQTVESQPFPQILYLHWAAISSNQLHHTACLMLLGSMPKRQSPIPGVTGSSIWHAKRICGISLTNPHHGCLNNAIQPLWLAGRLLSHESEHSILVDLIRDIESTTGWGTCWRIPDLGAAWGYSVRKHSRSRYAHEDLSRDLHTG
ncbi:hypothetical protein M419DRAFT_85085 [Trichoderma reesei RUT C-30]|uniref:C6 transcription factor n=2 Tax=Hypocrea jecorina TaxID=51453 RepID=A0A024S6K3_HYPJR|nr:hypothetical protein M419DRAFT_85085 [Trichoderma reesei RUT C-30]